MAYKSAYAESTTSVAEREHIQAFILKAQEYIKKNGTEKAFEEFSKPENPFREGDLYVFALNYNGVMVAHIDPRYHNKNILSYPDKHLSNAARTLIDCAYDGGGWVSYFWTNPSTGIISPKVSYVVPMDGYLIGAGYYTDSKK